MFKRISSIMLVFMLITNSILVNFAMPISAEADEANAFIFTDVKITDEENNEVNSESSHKKRIYKNSTINIEMNWEAGNISDTNYRYLLPEDLVIEKEQEGLLITNESSIGTYTVSQNGEINIVVENEEEIEFAKGSFIFKAKLDQSSVKEEEDISLTFALDNGDKVITIPLFNEEEQEFKKLDSEQDIQASDDEKGLASKQDIQASDDEKSKKDLKYKPKNTLKVELDHSSADNGKELFAYQQFTVDVKVNVSGAGTKLKDSFVLLEIDHEQILDISITPSSSIGEYEVIKKDGKTFIKIELKDIGGGTAFSFPVNFRVYRGVTPEGKETTVSTSIVDKEENEIVRAKSNPLSFKTKYRQYVVQKEIDGDPFDGQTVWGGMSDDDGNVINGKEGIVRFNYKISNVDKRTNHHSWYRLYDRVVITDTLPPNAHFDPELNPGWKLSADGKTVTYTIEAPENIKNRSSETTNRTPHLWFWDEFHNLDLKLTFPGSKKGDEFENKVDVDFQQQKKTEEEPNHSKSDTIKGRIDVRGPGLISKKAGSTYSIASEEYKELREIKDLVGDKLQEHSWYILLKNPIQSKADVVVEDYKNNGEPALDSRLQFTELRIEDEVLLESVEHVYVYTDWEGTKKEVTGQNGIYNLGEDAKGYRVEFKELPELMKTKHFQIISIMPDYQEVSFDRENAENNLFNNTADVEMTFADPDFGKVKAKPSDDFVLLDHDETICMTSGNKYSDAPIIRAGDRVRRYAYIHTDKLDMARTLKNARLITLLPIGIDPIPAEKAKKHEYGGMTIEQRYPTYDYDVVENYQGTGRTAYVYHFGDREVQDLFDEYYSYHARIEANRNFIEIYVPGIANKYAVRDNQFDFYFVHDGEQIKIGDECKKTKDIWDLNHNGDQDDEILYSLSNFNIQAVKEVLTTKYINDNENESWTFARDLTEGQTFNYRLNVSNDSDTKITKLLLYDVLPYEDDKVLIPNQSGKYSDRGSKLSNLMTGPIETPEGFTVYYLTEQPSENTSETIKNGNWQTKVSDYSQVKAIKIMMNEGTVVQAAEEVDFIIPMKAPEKWESNEKYGVNTFAFAYNEDVDELKLDEANKVKNRVYKTPKVPSIEKDVNGNKTEQAVEILLEEEYKYNVKTKIPSDVTSYSDSEFNKLTLIDVLDDRITVIGADAFVNGKRSDILKPTISGQEVKLTLDREQIIENAGKEINLQITAKIKPGTKIEVINNKAQIQLNDGPKKESNNTPVIPKNPLIEIEGKKYWKDGDAKNRPNSIKIHLLQNNVKKESQTVTAETDWKYVFKNLEKYDENGEPYKYTIEEDPVPGYVSEINDYNITNIRSEKKSIEIMKKWLDNDSAERPDSVTVNLLQNDKKIKTVELKASEDWKYIFEDLDAYDKNGIAYNYTVEEEPVKGYKSIVDGYKITNLRVGKIDLPITKRWEDNNSKKRPKEIEVDLLQNGKIIDTVKVTENNNWKHNFKNLDKFDENGKEYKYSIEEKVVDGYESTVVKTNNGYEITNSLMTDPSDPEPVEPTDPTDPSDPEPVEPTEPTDPSDPEPVEPTEPTDPSDPKPVKPTESNESKKPTGFDPNAENSSEKETVEKKLPKTATTIFKYILFGVMLVIIGLFLNRRGGESS